MAKSIVITLDGHTPVPAAPRWAAVYLRKSNDPKKTFLAVERQREKCELKVGEKLPEACEVRVYEDNDVTAYDEFEGREWARKLAGKGRQKERKEFNRLLADLEADTAGACVGVVAWSGDRMFRSIPDLIRFINLADGKAGRPSIPLHSVEGGELDLSSAEGRALALTKAAWARAEVEKQMERSREEKQQRRRRGMAYGGRHPSFGYRRGDEPGVLVVVPDERDAIQHAAGLFLAGTSAHQVAQWLNGKGFTGRGGKPFNGASVVKLLTSATLAAVLEPVRSDPVQREGKWEAILDYETVLAIRQVLRDRELARGVARPGPGPKPKYLLTGFLECGLCGSRHVHVGGSAARRVYTCLGAWWDQPELPPGLGKNHLARSVVPVDAYVTSLVLNVIERQAATDMLTDRGEDVAQLRAEVEKHLSLREVHYQDYKAGHIDGAEWARTKAGHDADIEEARGALARALGPSRPLQRFAGMDREAIEAAWAAASLDEQRLYVAQLIERIVLKRAGRGRPKGSGVGLARGKGGYFRDPIGTVEVRWRPIGSAVEADEGTARAGAGSHGGDRG